MSPQMIPARGLRRDRVDPAGKRRSARWKWPLTWKGTLHSNYRQQRDRWRPDTADVIVWAMTLPADSHNFSVVARRRITPAPEAGSEQICCSDLKNLDHTLTPRYCGCQENYTTYCDHLS